MPPHVKVDNVVDVSKALFHGVSYTNIGVAEPETSDYIHTCHDLLHECDIAKEIYC